MRRSLPFVLTIALIACGDAKSDNGNYATSAPSLAPQSRSDIAREMAEAPALRPGQYEVTSTVTRADNLEEEQRELADIMKTEIGKPEVSKICITPDMAKFDPQKQFSDAEEGQCAYDSFVVEGAVMKSQLSCKNVGDAAMVMKHKVVTRGDSSETILSVERTPPGKQPLVTDSKITMRRIGDCTGAMGH